MPSSLPNYADAIHATEMLRRLEAESDATVRLAALAEAVGVSEKTIRRYVKALGEAITCGGDPLVRTERRKGGTVVVLARARLTTAGAGMYQYAAVHAAMLHLAAVHDTVLRENAARAVERAFGTAVDAATLERVTRAFHYVPFGPKDYSAHDETLDSLVQALLHRRPVRIVYRKPNDRDQSVVLEPFTLVMYRDAIYLLARKSTSAGMQIQLYAVERMRSVEVDRKRRFELPPDYSPERYYADTFGIWKTEAPPQRVRLHFDAGLTALLSARTWPGQRGWKPRPPNGSVLELDVPVNPELVSWILGWGPRVTVLGPDSLRAEVASELRAAAERYGR